jgi:hypothetical protein
VNWHAGVLAPCVTPNDWSPIVIVPLRAAPVFAAAEYPTVPLPVPLAPEVTLSHDGVVLAAVHAHPLPDVTAIVPVPLAAGIDTARG